MHSVYRKTSVAIEIPHCDPSPGIVIYSRKLLCICIVIYTTVFHIWRELSLYVLLECCRKRQKVAGARGSLLPTLQNASFHVAFSSLCVTY